MTSTASSVSNALGEWAKIALPTIRRITPGLIASELIGVQPMSSALTRPIFNMKLSFEVERISAKNSDVVIFILAFQEDAGKGKDDPRLLGAEVWLDYLGEEKSVFKQNFVIDDKWNGFKITNLAMADFKERIDELTIGSDISHPRLVALINRAIDTIANEPPDTALDFALAVAKSLDEGYVK